MVFHAADIVWFDNALPAGANVPPDSDPWQWVNSTPTPVSGPAVNRSSLLTGLHQQYFVNATDTFPINAGDKLIAYVYLDPINPPSTVCLLWYDGSWEHRVYWGANTIPYGTNGTASLYYQGPLPATGQWVRLSVPGRKVGLKGHVVNGMAFTLYNGRAALQHVGKYPKPTPTPTPTFTP